jgi:hypothetical protein
MIYKLNLRDEVDGQVASLVKTRRRLKDRSKVQAQVAGESPKPIQKIKQLWKLWQ